VKEGKRKKRRGGREKGLPPTMREGKQQGATVDVV
jgi:hypothetical protein